MSSILSMTSSKRLFNPFKYSREVPLNGKKLVIKYTKRAEKALETRNTPLIIEMQIYFSCVVQKRVLFHESFEHETTPVDEKLAITIRSVESESCDPVYFASNHPEKRVLDSSGAKKMSAKELIIDYKNDEWIGCFSIV